MDALWASVAVGVALLVAAATLQWLRAPRAGSTSPPCEAGKSEPRSLPDATAAAAVAAAPTSAPAPAPAPAPTRTPTPALEGPSSLQLVDATLLPAERRRAYVDAFGKLPRPPRLLQHLLSPRLFQQADSRELTDLIRAEPLIAARVLSAVNSAAHALPCRITSLEQAVHWLGLDAVRILGLRYAMRTAFPTDSRERLRRLDELWAASGVAAELAQRLSSAPGFRSRGLFVSAVLLSFLGRIAVAAAAPRALLVPLSQRDPLQRLRAEQEALGLTAGQIGRLLMLEWKLDVPLVDFTAAIESPPLHWAVAFDPDDGALLALAYLCVRLGERIAGGELRSLGTFDPEAEERPEWTRWHEHLQHPTLAVAAQRLRSGEFDDLVERAASGSEPDGTDAPGAPLAARAR